MLCNFLKRTGHLAQFGRFRYDRVISFMNWPSLVYYVKHKDVVYFLGLNSPRSSHLARQLVSSCFLKSILSSVSISFSLMFKFKFKIVLIYSFIYHL